MVSYKERDNRPSVSGPIEFLVRLIYSLPSLSTHKIHLQESLKKFSCSVSSATGLSEIHGRMYSAIHSLPPLDFHASLDGTNLLGDPCLVLTSDPKPRLRWTAELHDRFVDAVTQLGGPDKATPKTIMRTMGVKGLTLYHLKSHLQKYRLGKLACKDFPDSSKDVESLDTGSSTPTSSSSSKAVHDLNEGYQVTEALRVQMEVQHRLHDQLEVQRRLQLRIEAQAKYLQSILEKACKAIVINDQSSSSAVSISICQDQEEAIHAIRNKNSSSNIPARFSDCSMESPVSPLLKKRTRPSFNEDGGGGGVDTLPLENGMRQMGWMAEF